MLATLSNYYAGFTHLLAMCLHIQQIRWIVHQDDITIIHDAF